MSNSRGATQFEAQLAAAAARMEAVLATALSTETPLLVGTPDHLLAAMRHGTLDGGKRLRPFLVEEATRLFGSEPARAAPVAAALECIHCYSLIHDDLPAMDDDDLRRGRPTVHKAFDEATAILAGDALLTFAFGLVAEAEGIPAEARLDLIRLLSRESGAAGMVGGQVLDLAAENASLTEAEIARMQAMKTGALIAFAGEAGPIIAGAGDDDRRRLRQYGEIIGLAYQLADDLLDETADAAALGKATGKDAARGKKTLPALHGQDWTRRELERLVAEAETVLAPYGARAATLKATARFVAFRDR